MIRSIVVAIAVLAALAGSALAHPFIYKITTNGTHLDGARAGLSGDTVGAVVLPGGATVTVR